MYSTCTIYSVLIFGCALAYERESNVATAVYVSTVHMRTYRALAYGRESNVATAVHKHCTHAHIPLTPEELSALNRGTRGSPPLPLRNTV